MVYLGSKNKYASEIVPILQQLIDDNNINYYIEPFVGGANIIDKIKCSNKLGYDRNYSLIQLHKIGQTSPELIPSQGSSDWWYRAKDIYRKYQGTPLIEKEMAAWEIGAIQFFASFCRGGFSRGYAKNTATRNYYNESYKNFMEQVKLPEYKNIQFECSKYDEIIFPEEKCLIYCDPPYQNTKKYGYAFETAFNYDEYWDWVRNLSKKHIVICSEQVFPEDFEIIWEKQVKRTTNKTNDFKAIERLGLYKVE